MPTWEDVVAIGTRFPEVEVGTSFGTPALRVRGKGMICRLRTGPDALVLRVIDLGDREALLQAAGRLLLHAPLRRLPVRPRPPRRRRPGRARGADRGRLAAARAQARHRGV
jgi:hypothetical protein